MSDATNNKGSLSPAALAALFQFAADWLTHLPDGCKIVGFAQDGDEMEIEVDADTFACVSHSRRLWPAGPLQCVRIPRGDSRTPGMVVVFDTAKINPAATSGATGTT